MVSLNFSAAGPLCLQRIINKSIWRGRRARIKCSQQKARNFSKFLNNARREGPNLRYIFSLDRSNSFIPGRALMPGRVSSRRAESLNHLKVWGRGMELRKMLDEGKKSNKFSN